MIFSKKRNIRYGAVPQLNLIKGNFLLFNDLYDSQKFKNRLGCPRKHLLTKSSLYVFPFNKSIFSQY